MLRGPDDKTVAGGSSANIHVRDRPENRTQAGSACAVSMSVVSEMERCESDSLQLNRNHVRAFCPVSCLGIVKKQGADVFCEGLQGRTCARSRNTTPDRRRVPLNQQRSPRRTGQRCSIFASRRSISSPKKACGLDGSMPSCFSRCEINAFAVLKASRSDAALGRESRKKISPK